MRSKVRPGGEANPRSGMIRSLTRHSMIYGTADVLNKLLLVLLIPLYTRKLGLADYGFYELLLVTLGTLEILADMGLSPALLRSRLLKDADPRAYYGTAWITQCAVALGLAAGLLAIRPALSDSLFGSRLGTGGTAALSAALVFWAMGRVAGTHLRLGERSVAYGALSLLRLLTLFTVHTILLLWLESGPTGLIAGLALAEGIYLAAALATARPPLSAHFRWSAFRPMALFGLPLVPLILAHMTLNQIDKFMIQHFKGLEEVGLYTVGYKVGMAVSLLANAFQMAWLPAMYTIARRPDARETFARILRYLLCLLVLCAAGLSLFSREIIRVITVEPYFRAHEVIPMVAWSYVFMGIYFVTMVGMNLTGRTYYLSLSMIGAALLNIGLNLWMIPAWGIQGAAWATLIAFVAMTLAQLAISVRLYPVPYEYARLTRIVTLGVAASAAGVLFGGIGAAAAVWKGIGLVVLAGILFRISFDPGERRSIREWAGRVIEKLRI